MRIRPFVVGLWLAIAQSACSGADNDLSPLSARGAGGANQGDAPSSAAPFELSFELGRIAALQPKEQKELRVIAKPAGSYRVRFALVDSGTDAALDRNESVTDAQGVASVVLTAPSDQAIFKVRASLGEETEERKFAELEISVSKEHMTLLVEPSYSGKRTVGKWVASIHHGKSCQQLPGIPPPDGSLLAEQVHPGPVLLNQVPVGVKFAVTMRGDQLAGGCAAFESVAAEQGPRSISIPISDRPLQLVGTEMRVLFGTTPEKQDFKPSMQPAILRIKGALVQNAAGTTALDDAQALLDQMLANISEPANVEEFTTNRSHDWGDKWDWDQLVRGNAVGPGHDQRLRAPTERWLQQGLESLARPDAFKAGLKAQTQAEARLDVFSIGGVPADVAGVTPLSLVTWSADPGDRLLLGTNVTWIPSRLLTALAQRPALAEVPTATSVPSALAHVAECAEISSVLTENSLTKGFAFEGCAKECVLNLCEKAIEDIWLRAVEASGTATAKLEMSATGTAEVGKAAEALALTGSWVGKFQSEGVAATASGPLKGEPPTEDQPSK